MSIQTPDLRYDITDAYTDHVPENEDIVTGLFDCDTEQYFSGVHYDDYKMIGIEVGDYLLDMPQVYGILGVETVRRIERVVTESENEY